MVRLCARQPSFLPISGHLDVSRKSTETLAVEIELDELDDLDDLDSGFWILDSGSGILNSE
jgi:hypothetical protein